MLETTIDLSDSNLNNLKRRIMRKIYVLWFFKEVTNPVTLKVAAPIAAFSVVFYHFCCLNIIKNAISSASSFYDIPKYFFNSFLTTEITDQLIVLGLIVFVGAVIWDLFKKGIPRLMIGI